MDNWYHLIPEDEFVVTTRANKICLHQMHGLHVLHQRAALERKFADSTFGSRSSAPLSPLHVDGHLVLLAATLEEHVHDVV